MSNLGQMDKFSRQTEQNFQRSMPVWDSHHSRDAGSGESQQGSLGPRGSSSHKREVVQSRKQGRAPLALCEVAPASRAARMRLETGLQGKREQALHPRKVWRWTGGTREGIWHHLLPGKCEPRPR